MDREILVVSFGTSYAQTREKTIGAIEAEIQGAFPEYSVRRAFTSGMIIRKLKKRDGIEIDNVKEAFERAVEEGVKELIVQPTHMMDGVEYTGLSSELDNYRDKFDKAVLAAPLLTDESDYEALALAVTSRTREYIDGSSAVIFMGHGTDSASNSVYGRFQNKLRERGFSDYYVGTVEAVPTLEDVIGMIKDKGYKRVVLEPLMVVAGDHASNDMAGEDEHSWKNVLKREGYEVVTILEGMGENPQVRAIYTEHTRKAVNSI